MFDISPQQTDYSASYISPYSIEYVDGRYVLYWLTKALSSHETYREAETALTHQAAA